MPSSAAIRLLRRRWSKPSGSRSRRPRSSTSKGVLRFAAARWSWRSGRHSLAGVLEAETPGGAWFTEIQGYRFGGLVGADAGLSVVAQKLAINGGNSSAQL